MRSSKILFTCIFLIINLYVKAQSDVEHIKQKLSEGNQRFVNSQMIHGNQDISRRNEVEKGQNPLAVIVGCSDSRIPPEIIFDQGLGDLFVIRTAGHVVDDIAIGSIEYAVEHLGVRLVVVLGHEKCGAVNAAVEGAKLHGNLEELIEEIIPAVKIAKTKQGNLLNNAIIENVKLTMNEISKESKTIKEIEEKGDVKIEGAVYSLSNGIVTFLD